MLLAAALAAGEQKRIAPKLLTDSHEFTCL